MIDLNILELQNSIARSRIDRSQSLTDVERLRGGADLYDEGMRWLTLAIRAENPEFSAEQIDAEIERRKAIVRRIDDNGLYRNCGMAETHGEE